MKLATYLSEHNMSGASLAARVGVSRQAMARYVAGDRIPVREIMTRIVAVTGGAVTPADFYDIGSSDHPDQSPVAYHATPHSAETADGWVRAECD